MLYLISYDIVDDDRRRRAHEKLKDFGRRVQYSVFECDLADAAGFEELYVDLGSILDEGEDSIRIYPVCERCHSSGVVLGKGDRYERKDFIIV